MKEQIAEAFYNLTEVNTRIEYGDAGEDILTEKFVNGIPFDEWEPTEKDKKRWAKVIIQAAVRVMFDQCNDTFAKELFQASEVLWPEDDFVTELENDLS